MKHISWFRNLDVDFLASKNNNLTKIYFSNFAKQKPTILLIHGFSGNAFGVSFLAKILEKNWNLILVELPSHGGSSLQNFENIEQFDAWYEEIFHQLEAKFGKISAVAGHSFGCYIVSNPKISSKTPTILINPVFQVSKSYTFFAKLASKSLFFAILQNSAILAPIRSAVIIRKFTPKSFKNVILNMPFSQNSWKKTKIQRKMTKIAFKNPIIKNERGKFSKAIIIGKSDTMTKKLTKNELKIFKNTEIFEISGGHIAPIEEPEIIAEIINTVKIKK